MSGTVDASRLVVMQLANAIPLAWADPLVCTGALDEPRAVTVNPQPIASSVLARR